MSVSPILVPATPNTTQIATTLLGDMAALSGVLTDYNEGSQIRTLGESIGSVVEQQGIAAQAEAYQAVAFSAMSIFGITPDPALAAAGSVTFATAFIISPPTVTQSVTIPQGTVVSTVGGTQFQTLQAALLPVGSSSVTVPVEATTGGSATNVPAGAISQLLSGLTYPLVVSNGAQTTGGADAEPFAQTLARLSAKVAAIGLASPVAIANAVLGVTVSGETVRYSATFEPWIVAASGTPASGMAGYIVYIDNGSGTASAALISGATSVLNGVSGSVGFRDAGVPFSVQAVVPTFANVSITAAINNLSTVPTVSGAIAQAVQGYFTLAFGSSAQQAQISATVANATFGTLTSLAVTLATSGSMTPVSGVSSSVSGRVLLGQLSIDVVAGA